MPGRGGTASGRFSNGPAASGSCCPRCGRYYPAAFDRYIEPFLGSGAVFLDLSQPRACSTAGEVRLSDINADMIGCYRMVRDARRGRSIEALRRARARASGRGGTRHFYEVRDERFNPLRRRHPRRRADPARRYTPELAAMLIYLNRTGYNGLFRLNSPGRVQRARRPVREPSRSATRTTSAGCRRRCAARA